MRKIKSWTVTKYVATGNDFLVVDLRLNSQMEKWAEFSKGLDRQEWTQRVCDRIEGVGADGLIFLNPNLEEGYDFSWDFFNSDGSSAEACGNAARVAVAFWCDQNSDSYGTIRFRAGMNLVKGRKIKDDEYEVELPKPKLLMKQAVFEVHGEKILCDLVDSGVPHLLVSNEDGQRNLNLAKSLRSHKLLDEFGANVTFWKSSGDRRVEAVTFERGVENFTMACGTGAIAAAWKRCSFDPDAKGEICVTMPGGELKISFEREEGVCLSGCVRPVFQGEVFL